DDVCGENAACDETCYPTQMDYDQDTNRTTCGEAAGYNLESCDLGAWETCSYECPGESSSHGCYEDGNWTTCGNYGRYLSCGDGICDHDNGEDAGNCGTDCATPDVPAFPSGDDDATLDLLEAFTNDVDSVLTDGGNSSHDLLEIQHVAYQY